MKLRFTLKLQDAPKYKIDFNPGDKPADFPFGSFRRVSFLGIFWRYKFTNVQHRTQKAAQDYCKQLDDLPKYFD